MLRWEKENKKRVFYLLFTHTEADEQTQNPDSQSQVSIPESSAGSGNEDDNSKQEQLQEGDQQQSSPPPGNQQEYPQQGSQQKVSV